MFRKKKKKDLSYWYSRWKLFSTILVHFSKIEKIINHYNEIMSQYLSLLTLLLNRLVEYFAINDLLTNLGVLLLIFVTTQRVT